MNQSPLNNPLNTPDREFFSTLFIPKIDLESNPNVTCSPAVVARQSHYTDSPLKLYTPGKNAQDTLQKIGLRDVKEEISTLKGGFVHYNSLGMTTAFFSNKEDKENAINELSDEYEFMPNFLLSLPNRVRSDNMPVNQEHSPLIEGEWPSESGVSKAHKQGIKGKGVMVGVLDTGVDADHQEFSGKSITYRYVPLDPESLIFRFPPPRDVRGFDLGGHGTQVCGIIAGKSIGIAPEADLYVASVIDSETMLTSLNRVIRGLAWLMKQFSLDENKGRPAVLNMSICFSPSPLPPSIPNDEVFKEILERMRKSITTLLVQANVLPVIAIGNEGQGKFTYPGAFKEVLSVGSVNHEGKLSLFSGSGQPPDEGVSKPDVVGYGENVRTCLERSYAGESVYKHSSGTSIASPYVAGIAALYRCQNPSLTVEEVRTKIIENVHKHKLNDQSIGEVGAGLASFVLDEK